MPLWARMAAARVIAFVLCRLFPESGDEGFGVEFTPDFDFEVEQEDLPHAHTWGLALRWAPGRRMKAGLDLTPQGARNPYPASGTPDASEVTR